MTKYFFYFLLLLSFSNSGRASQIIRPDPQAIVKETNLILVAKIVAVENKDTPCWSNTVFTLQPESGIKGELKNRNYFEYSITHPSFSDKNGDKPGCPMSVVWVKPPEATTLRVGDEIIVAIIQQARHPVYEVVQVGNKFTVAMTHQSREPIYEIKATFNLSELDNVKKWFFKKI